MENDEVKITNLSPENNKKSDPDPDAAAKPLVLALAGGRGGLNWMDLGMGIVLGLSIALVMLQIFSKLERSRGE